VKAWYHTVAVLGFAGLVAAQAPTIGNCTVFPADNVWNTRIDQLPVHPSSSTWVSKIGPSSPLHPDFGTGTNGIPFITVPGTQTKYPVSFTVADESDPGPYAIPLNAPIEAGGDSHAISIDTDNCILYELYLAAPHTASWTAYSGAIFNLSSQALRTATFTSADAAGLPIAPGLVRYEEILAGEIRHAIRFTVPSTQRAFVWPARHYASTITDPAYPPMGARFRLKASFDISGFSATNQIILTALKRYGMMLADNGSAWFITGKPDDRWDDSDLHALTTIAGSNFEAVDATVLMIDPNSGQALQSGTFVSVSPGSASVQINAQKQFSATVTGNADQSVTWDVNGSVGGNSSVGFIDSITGLYTAPAAVPSPATVTVHARSNAVPAAIGSASVTITPPPPPVSITISPTSATVQTSRTQQFTATVSNTTNTGVTWQVNGVAGGNSTVGTVSTSGLYTAPGSVPSPATVTVSAISNADPTKSAGSTVTITVPPPVSIAISPATATVRVSRRQTFTATVKNTTNTGVTWKVNGIAGGNATVGSINSNGVYTAPGSVPSPAAVTVSAVSKADPTKSASATVTIFKK